MKNMKKILVLSLAAVLLVAVSVGGTIAYLKAETEEVTNTFTPASVNVSLTETTGEEYQMIPKKEHTKDPTVSVAANPHGVPYYVFVKMTETNNPSAYLDYSVDSAWTALDATAYPGVYYIDVTTGYTDAKSWGVLTGNKVTVKETLENSSFANMTSKDKYPSMTFQAWAIQQEGFNGNLVNAYKQASGE